MEAIPRDYGEQCRFDAFCKTVLRNEARNYHRDMKRQRDRETSFSVLPQAELDKLYTVDHYPSDDFVFSSHGYDLHIDNELVAAAFAELPQQAQSILILLYALEDHIFCLLAPSFASFSNRKRASAMIYC